MVWQDRGMIRHSKRKVYFVDREVQGGLLHKSAWYWLLSLAVVGSLNVLGWIFIAPGADVLVKMREHLPSFFAVLLVAMASSLIVLPVLLFDLSRHTNRFAGPIFRLQRSLNALAEGKPVEPLTFRKGDNWHELAEAFNRVLIRLRAAEAQIEIQHCQESHHESDIMTDCEETSAV
jgi:signal transduction histidine kinase